MFFVTVAIVFVLFVPAYAEEDYCSHAYPDMGTLIFMYGTPDGIGFCAVEAPFITNIRLNGQIPWAVEYESRGFSAFILVDATQLQNVQVWNDAGTMVLDAVNIYRPVGQVFYNQEIAVVGQDRFWTTVYWNRPGQYSVFSQGLYYVSGPNNLDMLGDTGIWTPYSGGEVTGTHVVRIHINYTDHMFLPMLTAP